MKSYKYKAIVQRIRGLDWRKLSTCELEMLMILSAYSAKEFAESLRIALKLYPDNPKLNEMAGGEIATENISFGDYNQKGDHVDFLEHFIVKYKISELYPEANKAGELYLSQVRLLSDSVRAMSVFSRENELPKIFELILEARDWSKPILTAYKHYLTEHIRLDTMEGGHAELLSDFIVTNDVKVFYKIRLDMYRCVPKLFI